MLMLKSVTVFICTKKTTYMRTMAYTAPFGKAP